jgi:hypothetical protein
LIQKIKKAGGLAATGGGWLISHLKAVVPMVFATMLGGFALQRTASSRAELAAATTRGSTIASGGKPNREISKIAATQFEVAPAKEKTPNRFVARAKEIATNSWGRIANAFHIPRSERGAVGFDDTDVVYEVTSVDWDNPTDWTTHIPGHEASHSVVKEAEAVLDGTLPETTLIEPEVQRVDIVQPKEDIIVPRISQAELDAIDAQARRDAHEIVQGILAEQEAAAKATARKERIAQYPSELRDVLEVSYRSSSKTDLLRKPNGAHARSINRETISTQLPFASGLEAAVDLINARTNTRQIAPQHRGFGR